MRYAGIEEDVLSISFEFNVNLLSVVDVLYEIIKNYERVICIRKILFISKTQRVSNN